MEPKDVHLVGASFALVADGADQAAALFYGRLFELDPSLRPLFPDDMAAQGRKLMLALQTVVGALDRPDRLLPVVRELGRRHARYGVTPEHYRTVGDALIWTLQRGLGANFTVATRQAWVAAYELLARTMIAAGEADVQKRRAA